MAYLGLWKPCSQERRHASVSIIGIILDINQEAVKTFSVILKGFEVILSFLSTIFSRCETLVMFITSERVRSLKPGSTNATFGHKQHEGCGLRMAVAIETGTYSWV